MTKLVLLISDLSVTELAELERNFKDILTVTDFDKHHESFSVHLNLNIDYQNLNKNKDSISKILKFIQNSLEKNFLYGQETGKIPELGTDQDLISNLEISVRTASILEKAGIVSINKLIQMSEYELRRLRGLGRKSFAEIEKVLKDKGLSIIPSSN